MKKCLLLTLIFILLISLLIPSCESFKKDPEFVGTWQFTEKITSNNLVYNTTRTIKLTGATFEETYLIQRENSPIISAILGTKGIIISSRTSLIFSLEELGTCKLDASEKCTNEVQWFGEGSGYWNDNIQYFKKNVSGRIDVSGTTLWLIRDLNDDGDFDDTGEDVIFELLRK